MGGVNPAPVPPLPERPNAVDVHEALADAANPNLVERDPLSIVGATTVLAAEVQHLQKICEDDGWSWGVLYVRAQSVVEAAGEDVQEWLREQGRGRLADELEELSYAADGDSQAERQLAAMSDVVAAARLVLRAWSGEDVEGDVQNTLDAAVGRLDLVARGGR